MIYIIMGVSGCGKTTIGSGLSKSLGTEYHDADGFHPEANIEKMRSGKPLNDDDRIAWLNNIHEAINAKPLSKTVVISCSALKAKHRAFLRTTDHEVVFCFLQGSKDLIRERILARENHYFKESLLDSQFETLEEPKTALYCDVSKTPEEIINFIISETSKKKVLNS